MRGTGVHQEIGRGAPPRGESRPDDDVTHACLGSTPLRLPEGRSMTMAHRLPAIHRPARPTRGQGRPLASPPRPFHNPPMSLVNDITSFAATAVRLGRGAFPRAGWRLPVPHPLDDLDSMLASAVRLGRGARCRRTRELAGVLPLILYNMEGSPYCRKVREALSELDLEHVVRNVPKGSPKRAALVERGGKMQVPYLIDPNTDRALYESDDIVAYLEAEYA